MHMKETFSKTKMCSLVQRQMLTAWSGNNLSTFRAKAEKQMASKTANKETAHSCGHS
jgi:hypothetical protein